MFWFIRKLKSNIKKIFAKYYVHCWHIDYMQNFRSAHLIVSKYFFNFIISWCNIQIKQSYINIINEWLILKSAKNILVFLELANFYQRFIEEFFQIITFLTNLTTSAKKKEVKSIFVWDIKIQKTFFRLKTAFINIFIL